MWFPGNLWDITTTVKHADVALSVVLYLFAVGGHEVETTGGDIEVDGHARKLEITLSQNAGQSFGWWLRGKIEKS